MLLNNREQMNVTIRSEEVFVPSRTFVETNMIVAAATYWYVL